MSCEYQRYRIWQGVRSWYHRNVPEATRRDFENAIEDFVSDWIENALEEEGQRAVREYRKSTRTQTPSKPKPVGGGAKKPARGKKGAQKQAAPAMWNPQRRVIADPEDPFEKVYHTSKEIIMPGHVQWSDDQRREMTEKMQRVMHWMRVHGRTPDANPIHGRHGLPRISSVASYAIVHDWLTAQGVKIASPFDSIYAAVRTEATLTPEQIHDLEHLLEELEIEHKKRDANPEQEEEFLFRIRHISPAVFDKIIQKFPKFRALAA